jgi:hypothetical protein
MEDTRKQFIKAEPKLMGWRICAPVQRKKIQSRGQVVNEDFITKHAEQKKTKTKKKAKQVDAPKPTPYLPSFLTGWQRKFSTSVHVGHHVIVGSTTSSGKTFTANLIAAHEVLQTDDTTGLIISPNSEVMRDTVKDIESMHKKAYLYPTKTMMSTQTRNFCNYENGRFGPPGQLMVITIDSAVEFFTNPINETFIRKLRIIVFDEVHLSSVSNALWWSQFLPQEAQLVVLSATLGDIQHARALVQGLGSKRPTTVLECNVRPIPLQMAMFKGCDLPTKGVASRELRRKGRLACAINRFDPTPRDLKSMLGLTPPEDREAQFHLGEANVDNPVIDEKNAVAMQGIVHDPTPENIFKLLCYLFDNDMAPAMVFNATTEKTKFMAEQLIGFIQRLESEDVDYKRALALKRAYDKAQQRKRDAEEDSGEDDDLDLETHNMFEVNKVLGKWKFPNDFQCDTHRMEMWIANCLEYGIGVYVASMKPSAKHLIFDAVREGKLRVLFSDASISVGINLPIRTAVLCGAIPHHIYKQAGGRAGRRGHDTQGFIVHMMPPRLIEKYLNTSTEKVTLKLPERMSYTDLIRLKTPENLLVPFDPNELDPATPEGPTPALAKHILSAYMDKISVDELEGMQRQLEIIHRESLHYHRLTNFIKFLPYNESIVVVKLMITGEFAKMNVRDVINLVALLFFRREFSEARGDNPLEFYVPYFSEPRLKASIKRYLEHYDIDIDVDTRIHHYLYSFCFEGKQYLEFIEELDHLKEWLYILKRGVDKCAPTHNTYVDPTHQVVRQTDTLYLSACTRKGMDTVLNF